ncbi:N-acetylglucosamine/diacetylchitobiose ABC transporter substrate-binding protein [Streptomyces triticagri]|nr:N-acetylglucosamine/diacetylchitobiose ABC transporter substrate-binding protein [Streptomyces triticagri]
MATHATENPTDNPFGVRDSDALEVVVFDGGLGDRYVLDAEDRYRAAYPGAHITHTAVPDIRAVVGPRLDGDDAPDLVDNTGPGSLPTAALASDGRLTDLRPLLEAPSCDDPERSVGETLISGVAAKGRFGGDEVWALNYAFTAFGIWYSQQLLDEHGWSYPRTWDEMLALCEEAKRAGIAGFTYPGVHPYYLQWTLYPFIAKIGGTDVLRSIDNLEPNAWRHPAVLAAFEAYHELAARGHVLAGSSELDHIAAQTAWTEGKALFLPNGTWVEKETRDTTPPGFRMTVSPPTGLDEHDALPFGVVWAQVGEAYVIPRSARNPRGAAELLRLMLGRRSARDFALGSSSLSCVRGALAGADLPSGLASADAMLAAAGDLVIAPRTDWYQTLNREVIAGLIGEMMACRITPAEAVRRIQQAADETARDPEIKKFRHP